MIRYYLPTGETVIPLAHIRESLQYRDKVKYLKPTGDSLFSQGIIRMGREITGCVTLRLDRENLPDLLYLICGSRSELKPVPQTHSLLQQTLTARSLQNDLFSLIRREQEELQILEEVELTGFELAGRRTEAVSLKLELEGAESRSWSFGKEEAPSPRGGGFLFLKGDEVEVNSEELPDLAAFSFTGQYTPALKGFELMIRRKDSETADYRFMRKTLSVRITLSSRELFEENQRVRCDLEIPSAFYLGEESFPDNKGIWGREFRYWVRPDFTMRTYQRIGEEL